MVKAIGIPDEAGLYSPKQEKDSCGVGFIAHKHGAKSHQVVEQGLEILIRLAHRGAVGADPETGDGAGISIQMPDQFLRKVMQEKEVELPPVGDYGVGMLFLPQDKEQRQKVIDLIEKIIVKEGQELLGWRDVPVDVEKIGENAASKAPFIKQLIIKKNEEVDNFELELYFIRRAIEKAVSNLDIEEQDLFNVTSFSSQILIYKGLLLAQQISEFYLDLQDETMQSGFALVHQRYSTNTFPSWDLAQPFKYLAHNGEINTLRGNINWMAAREPSLQSDVLGDRIEQLFPITDESDSDSANLNSVVELMVASGMDVVEAMTTLIPEAWEENDFLDQSVKSYHEYNSALMEPWDGPAAIGFTDGKQIGAKLDRNGLRPARYTITKDDYIIAASEVGTLDIPADNIAESGRLQPGEMFVVDTEAGEVIHDAELKEELSSKHPYGKWLADNKEYLSDLTDVNIEEGYSKQIKQELKAFGYSREDLELLITPMASNQKEAIGSMGNDTPLAVLSNRTKPLFNYFKQLFAQVTNPPMDSIREKIVMSLKTNLGSESNILERTADKAKTIEFDSPIINNNQLAKIANLDNEDFQAATINTVFDPEQENALQTGLIKLFNNVTEKIEAGANVIILSDREVGESQAPIPSLLAISAVHNYLIENRKRNGVDLVVETGEAREVMHFALLVGYGALAVNPYLALESISYLSNEGLYLTETNDQSRIEKRKNKYLKAIDKGLLKIMSKMGISTVKSYRGAQIFEAVGLSSEFVEQYFPGTATRIEGIGLDILEEEVKFNHQKAYNDAEEEDLIANEGEYKWRSQGEHHLFSPEAIAKLQDATRKGDYEIYKDYAQEIDNQSENLATIRGLFDFKNKESIPLEEVEPVEEIRKRFVTGAMSFGSISKEAHETLAKAMNEIGGMSNSGEGGEDPERFKDDRRSAIKQVASGRFGVTTNYLVNADELQIKMAQGAKPGEGGHLPGKKVSEVIAKVRHTTPGIDLISPPPHHDIYSIEDLAQLIFDLKNVNPDSRVSVKLVSEVGIGTIAAGVSKAHADMILVSGFDGGTGAAPLTSIKHAGLPWELGVSETHQVLVKNNLRSRVKVQTDGQMKTGRDVAIAALLGAEEYGFATAPLVVLGCIMMRQCNENNCPVGIATQDPRLRERFAGSKEQVINFFTFIAQHLREIMAELGFRTVDEMIGHTDKLDMNDAIKHWKSEGIDVEKILYQQQEDNGLAVHCTEKQDHGIDDILDRELLTAAKPALEKGEQVTINKRINNTNRTAGTMLSGAIAKEYGEEGLADDTITVKLTGYAGQSFGAFAMQGLTMKLEGQANDYVGKGMFGGKIIVKQPEDSDIPAHQNTIAGNTILYGATEGELYMNGVAGERFAVRNSGAKAVVEGIGDHGCEYMTGGQVVVLGLTGRNFAAGMSGGIAYVYDIDGTFRERINDLMVDIEELNDNNLTTVKELITNHVEYTASERGAEILENWEEAKGKFIKIIPPKYKEIIADSREEKSNG